LKLLACKDKFARASAVCKDRRLFLLDILFHTEILDWAKNPVLSSGYRHICRKLFIRLHDKQLHEEKIKKILAEHRDLYQAVFKKDVKQARVLLKMRQAFIADWYQLDPRRLDRFEEKLTSRGQKGKQSFPCSFAL
jgi:DNA-binding GntR family transcriptional regulator